jgi:flagellar biosynthesis protein FlhG
MNDQAQSLRDKLNRNRELGPSDRKTKVITVTSGKGGVGKSNFSLNFALGLQKKGQKVILIDMDLGFANIDILMGISSKKNIVNMIDNRTSIWDIIELGPEGLQFIAGGSGLSQVIDMDEHKLNYFFDQLALLNGYADTVILDTGAGVTNETLRYILSADDVVLVTTPEPTSITDAYAVIKMTSQRSPHAHFSIVVNRAINGKEGRITGDRLLMVARQFLQVELVTLGYVPDDAHVSKAVKKQEPFLLAYPSSRASEAIRSLVESYLIKKTSYDSEAGIKAFVTRLRHLWKK